MNKAYTGGMMFFDLELGIAHSLALAYAGHQGRIATLPDVIEARLAADKNAPIWNWYVSTNSAEYFGTTKAGNQVVIVAHGVGPLVQADRFDAKKAFRGNGFVPNLLPIARKEFLALEAGHYGGVHVSDLSEFHMRGILDSAEAAVNTHLEKRLGSRALEYIVKHARIAREEQGNDYIIDNNEDYEVLPIWLKNRKLSDPSFSGGSLLVISQLCNTHHSKGSQSLVSVTSDIYPGKIDGASRFVGVRGSGPLLKVHEGMEDIDALIRDDWQKFMVLASVPKHAFYTLLHIGNELFAVGATYGGVCQEDTVPIVHVTKKMKIPGPKLFRTTIGGYHGLVKYNTSEVRAIAPSGANAFLMGEFGIVWKKGNPHWHQAPVAFYRIDVDRSQRLLREEEVRRNLPRTLELLGI